MNKCIIYFLSVAFCLIGFSNSHAQDIDSVTTVVTQDSIYHTDVSSSENYEFKEQTGDSKIDTRKVPHDKVKQLKSNEEYWYVDQAPSGDRESSPPGVNEKGEKEKQQSIRRSRQINFPAWARALFWIILIGGFTVLLIWFLATSDIRMFRKKTNAIEEPIEEPTTDNIFEMNFEKEIQKAIEAKNFRLAVRLLYLRTLRDLSNRNLINYTHEKTNSEYLLQLGNTPYYKNFFKLTRNFDYTWYGQFELSQESFTLVQNDFSSFKQQLSR
jgi:hypothetical protein